MRRVGLAVFNLMELMEVMELMDVGWVEVMGWAEKRVRIVNVWKDHTRSHGLDGQVSSDGRHEYYEGCICVGIIRGG